MVLNMCHVLSQKQSRTGFCIFNDPLKSFFSNWRHNNPDTRLPAGCNISSEWSFTTFRYCCAPDFWYKARNRWIGRVNPVSWPPQSMTLPLATSFFAGGSKIEHPVYLPVRFSSWRQSLGLLYPHLFKELFKKSSSTTKNFVRACLYA